MTITAKYASRCATCHQPITTGQQIEWAKGQPVRHTSCPRAVEGVPAATYVGRVLVADMPRRARSRRGTWTGCRCGSVEEYGRESDCASCRFDRDDC